MSIRSRGTLLAAVTAAFVIAPGLSALAQFSPPGFGGSNTSDRMGGGGGGKGATAAKSSKSNTSDRMGGGGGLRFPNQIAPTTPPTITTQQTCAPQPKSIGRRS